MKKKTMAALLLALSLGVPASASVIPQDYSYHNGGMNQWESEVYFFNQGYGAKIAALEERIKSTEAELATLEVEVGSSGAGSQLAAFGQEDPAALEAEAKLERIRKGLVLLKGEVENLAMDKEILETRTDRSFLPVLVHADVAYPEEAAELLSEEYIMPTCGYETSPYGWRIHPVTGIRSMHNGIDLAGSQGTKIHAAKSAIVIFSGYNEISGNNLILRHYDGQETAYYHMHEIIAEEGQYVMQGDVIGLMGTTGRSTGNHLHFEIRINGERVDPDPYIYRGTRWEQR